MLRSFALVTCKTNDPDKEIVYPNLSRFRDLLEVLDSGNVPNDCIAAFGSQYFLALHKDIDDDTKLCPLGIGTHLRRVLGTMETYAYASQFAQLLWPFQFGIALPAGWDAISNSCLSNIMYQIPSRITYVYIIHLSGLSST